jgi:hypothetical protein
MFYIDNDAVYVLERVYLSLKQTRATQTELFNVEIDHVFQSVLYVTRTLIV